MAHDDDISPATRAYFDSAFKVFAIDLKRYMDVRYQRLQEDLDLVLDNVVSMDKRLSAVTGSHEKRIGRLEQTVGIS